MAESVKTNITAKEFDEEMSPLALDLIALFNVMQEEIMEEFNKGVDNGKTPDEIIKTIEDKI